jgi:hypothetical protein
MRNSLKWTVGTIAAMLLIGLGHQIGTRKVEELKAQIEAIKKAGADVPTELEQSRDEMARALEEKEAEFARQSKQLEAEIDQKIKELTAALAKIDGGAARKGGAAKSPAIAAEKAARSRSTIAGGAPAAAAASPELSVDRERMRQRDEYINSLKKGAYTFNPPSPIEVEQRITVALWVDPAKEAAQLAEEMKKAYPESAARVEAGDIRWSPRMRAALTGGDFEITPVEGQDFDGVKDLSATNRNSWEWDIVPKWPGKKRLLHLRLEVILPPGLGTPWEIVLDREIEVEVTLWWLLDHFWEKYWKWMIGGLASAAGAAMAYWWKNRRRGK